jgi:hypothetical protein
MQYILQNQARLSATEKAPAQLTHDSDLIGADLPRPTSNSVIGTEVAALSILQCSSFFLSQSIGWKGS